MCTNNTKPHLLPHYHGAISDTISPALPPALHSKFPCGPLAGLSIPCLQILRIDMEGMIDDVLKHGTWVHLCKKYLLTQIATNLPWHKTRKKEVVAIVTFELIGLLFMNHIMIIMWFITMACRILLGKHSMLTLKELKEYKIFEILPVNREPVNRVFEILLSESRVNERNAKLQWLSRRFHTLIWRPGDMVQNLASPRLSGRVDSTALDFNSWVNPN